MSAAVLTPAPRTRKSPKAPGARAGAKPAAGSRRLGPPVQRALPAGLPRAWYIDHNRRLKAMRLAVVLLDTGLYTPGQATNRRIRSIAARIGIHRPSAATCRLVRSLLHQED
ncbi:hypothetical protein [Kitasatospora sp. NPDC057223]|uniref:hypothetical protein n=1 Tax=Kitasatospora sp. NPDC057223 TaxID=3346055 RepID=UPI00363F71E7